MRVLYFGTYERDYPRNAHTIALLRRAGIEVVERHEPVWERTQHAWRPAVRTTLRLARAELRLARRIQGEFDAVIVGYPGHPDVLSVRRAVANTPLILNPLVSLADTVVADRGQLAPTSLAARALQELDRHAFTTADVVVADTRAHAALFRDLGARRVEVCAVGADERIFHGPWTAADPPHVLFVGKLIPLHGVDVILDAARATPGSRFVVVGDGQLAHALRARPQNVEWRAWVPYERLGEEYRRAACALGIFGTSAKAARVIPNKAYHALACGTPLVTADTPAARELLEHRASALLVRRGDAGALAAAIDALHADERLRERLSSGGRAAFRANAADDVLAVRWRDIVVAAAR